MNTITIVGNLCSDINLESTYEGHKVVKNSVAVSRGYKNPLGEYIVDFIPVTLWDGQAEFISKYGYKGCKVAVSGSLYINTYTDKNGQNQKTFTINVSNVEIHSRKEDPNKVLDEAYGNAIGGDD